MLDVRLLIAAAAVASLARVDGLGLEMPRHLGRRTPEPAITPEAPLATLWVDARGNVGSPLRVEAVVFDPASPPDGISQRCLDSARNAMGGTRVLVCFETDELARLLDGDL